MATDELIGIVAITGEEGTGKTSMGLSFPKPLSHLDVDVGGYARAAWRKEVDTANIISTSFPKPLTDADIAKMMGRQDIVSTRTSAIPKKVEGMKELWQKIIDKIVTDCLNPEIKSIVIDSATMMYKIGCDAYLQELQEKQLYKWKNDPNTKNRAFDENDYREKLQPIEYGTVYDRLQRVFHATRSYKKNLILIHYPTDEYGAISDGKGGMTEGKTGKIIMDGYKDTAKFSDLVVWLSVKSQLVLSDPDNMKSQKVEKKLPFARITKSGIPGMGLQVVGMEVPATYEGIINLRNLLTGGS